MGKYCGFFLVLFIIYASDNKCEGLSEEKNNTRRMWGIAQTRKRDKRVIHMVVALQMSMPEYESEENEYCAHVHIHIGFACVYVDESDGVWQHTTASVALLLLWNAWVRVSVCVVHVLWYCLCVTQSVEKWRLYIWHSLLWMSPQWLHFSNAWSEVVCTL